MELATQPHAPLTHLPRRPSAGIRQWLEGLREQRRARHDMIVLSRLSDHLLRDIGLEGRVVRRADPLGRIEL
ncbi:hypothetical protein DEA8626_03833 [Defluviimonas aquaemixtae]|uniref:YjiS-like domain-containing protein n=1 Tax=Albidovulum aquaemixtae TaxID=1542388 RepID=A0A2R8BMX4_9RHOB|nr:hypothetical protein DEA8626_03833 [Defluviimonas aquaemixtae]